MLRERCPARARADDRRPPGAVRRWRYRAWKMPPVRLVIHDIGCSLHAATFMMIGAPGKPARGCLAPIAMTVAADQSIAACTRFATRSSRAECQGSGYT